MTPAAVSEAGDACSWDGRLDRGGTASGSPAGSALACYRRQGIGGFHQLIGDWSLALWDAASRTVLLASDYAGIRPLYYHRGTDRLLWSSSLADLVRWTGIQPLDEVFAARFLAHGGARLHTPYPGIYSVPPGCAVAVSGAGTKIERFWDLPVAPAIRLGDDRAYELNLWELFREAVAVRVRPHARVGAELSGGLDSSSVVTMAATLGAGLTTFSYTHEGSTDERYFRAVERHCGIEGVHFHLNDCPFVAADQTGGASPGWWEPRFRRIASHLDELGAFLTGQLGDFTMGNVLDDSDQVAGYLRRGLPAKAAREAYQWSQALRIPIYPILWRALRMSVSSWTPAGDSDFSPVDLRRRKLEDSLTASFARRAREATEPDAAYEPDWRAAPPDRRRRFRALAETLQLRRLQAPEPLQHLCYTHPFAHRPLVEFMLAVPRGVVCRPGEPRLLMRRAFAGLLPEAVLTRRSKASYTAVFSRSLAPLAAAMLQRPERVRLVEMGLFDRTSLAARLERYTQALDCNETQLRQIILLEFWLRGRTA
jgi:asparagine synthase (glutamine-hydrolysing)